MPSDCDPSSGWPRPKWRPAGPVQIREILEVVASVGETGSAIDSELRHLYDWHHARGVTALQLAFAPGVVAAVAIAAKGASLAVIMIAAAIVVGSLLIGLWRLHQINQLHGEYVVALRLGRAFAPLHATLATCLHRQAIDPVASTEQQAIATKLYKKLGAITMVEYRSQCCNRQRVLRELREAQRAAGPAVDP